VETLQVQALQAQVLGVSLPLCLRLFRMLKHQKALPLLQCPPKRLRQAERTSL
jgi:hypothetical protein